MEKETIVYKEEKDFTAQQLGELFASIGWESANYPNRLVTAMKNSSVVISAWDGEKLVGLIRGIDDGAALAILHYLLVRPDYQKYHIGSGLMERIMEKYSDMLYVKVIPSDPKVIPFYERFGFAQYDNYSAMAVKNFDQLTDF